MGELHRLLPSHIQKIYYPIDRRAYVDRAVRTIHPETVVLVEAEIWPNFLWMISDHKIPLFLVNARLSKKSYRGYRRWGRLFRPLFQAFHGVGCQNEEDAARLRELGCRPERIHVVGNLKFDAAKLEERSLIDVPGILRQLGVREGSPVLIGGSTHAGEEEVLAKLYRNLKPRFPGLFLIVAPRHFERGREAGRALESQGLKFQYRKSMSAQTTFSDGELDCLLLNTTGELKYFYEHATVIFVGKSLTTEGGQNPIEPGALGKPILFGPNMQNFEAVARSFVEGEGAIQVRNALELEDAIGRVLSDQQLAGRLGDRAVEVVKKNLGAIERTVDMILTGLDDLETYKAPAGGRAAVSRR
jgi:3-deoxy-D-manno-octulosonic-acid transferase